MLIEFLRGRPRGGRQLYFTFPSAPDPFFKASSRGQKSNTNFFFSNFKSTGPKWSKMVQTTILVKMTLFRTGFYRERKLNTNFFFSNFSGTAGISRQNPGISRPKSLISLVSRDIPNFLAPTRARGRPLPHWKISRLKSLGLCSFFVPDQKLHFSP